MIVIHGKTARRAFTLVELLVVIGIIGMLIALLLPALQRVRYQSQLTQCSSHLHHVGIAVLAYANDNKGWYPYRMCNKHAYYSEPYWLVSEPAHLNPGGVQYDDRPLFRPYLNSVNYLRCPLAPEEIDIDSLNDGKAIVGGYELWFGSEFVRGDKTTRMYKAGERPRYGPHRFRTLAADIEREANFLNKVNSGHPDFQKLTPLLSIPPTYSSDPTAALAQYHNPHAIDRGPIDRHFLYDDGSVPRIPRLRLTDVETVKVPYISYVPITVASGRLPPD